MCGINGVVSRGKNDSKDIVLRMQKAVLHRGPDGDGWVEDDQISAAMRRLSIIDLKGGSQPLMNERKDVQLLINGEIYNFIELRQELEQKGHVFSTHSDGEVVVHLYEEYGIDCVKHLRGMFAFFLYDMVEQKVFLVRDRIGEKPLYLYQSSDELIFSSELKGILASKKIPFELEPWAINLYFHYQFVPEPHTPIKNVRKLSAGHFLSVNLKTFEITEQEYWSYDNIAPIQGDPIDQIQDVLNDTMDIILRSDVPVGVALSGGLDSGAIACMMAKRNPGQIKAFTVGYKGTPEIDERHFARDLAKTLNIDFTEIELTTQEVVDNFAHMVLMRDDPMADISGYGYYAVMKAAHEQGIKVMLQGQGGDELFWGYGWFHASAFLSRIKQNPLAFNNLWMLYKNSPKDQGLNWKGKVANLFGFRPLMNQLALVFNSPKNRLPFWDLAPDFRETQLKYQSLYHPDFYGHLQEDLLVTPESLFEFERPWEDIDSLLVKVMCETYLLENGITQGDRLSMASSVELRLPLVDYKLFETVLGARKNQSDYTLPSKGWLKSVLKNEVPSELFGRKKRGFTPPTAEWTRGIHEQYSDWLPDGYLVQTNVLTKSKAEYLAQAPLNNTQDQLMGYKALVLEIWCQEMQKYIQ